MRHFSLNLDRIQMLMFCLWRWATTASQVRSTVWMEITSQFRKSQTTSMARTAPPYKANPKFSSSRPVVEVSNTKKHVTKPHKNTEGLRDFFVSGEKDIGFEVSPDEAKPSIGGDGDQTDAIPFSSSSESLSTSDETDAIPTLPTPSDILVSYSTFPGLFPFIIPFFMHVPL